MRFDRLWLIVFAASFVFSAAAFADGAPIGRLTGIEGRVDRTRSGSLDYAPLDKGEDNLPGDVIRTKGYSRAEIRFADQSVMRLSENTQVQIREYSLDPDGSRKNGDFFVDRGMVRAIVAKSKTGQMNFMINTPNARGGVKGSDIFVSYLRSATGIVSFSGEFAAKSPDFPDKAVVVKPGTTAMIPFGEAPQAPRALLAIERQKFERDTATRLPQRPSVKKGAVGQAVVARLAGNVRIRTAGSAVWHRAMFGEALGMGDTIETGPDGYVRVVLESGRDVTLRPNSQILIKQMIYDAKSGTRQDSFETTGGEIRARVEKQLRKGSSFQITGPTAIGAVRGTIMYYYAHPDGTSCFFEQGQGSLTSLLKKLNILINPGSNGSVDKDGNISGPVETTQRERESNEKDWADDYGYTPADRPLFQVQFEGNPSEHETPGENQKPFDEIQQDINQEAGPNAQPVEYGVWGGQIDTRGSDEQPSSLYRNDDGSVEGPVGHDTGIISGQTEPFASPQTFTAAGTFTNFNENGADEPLIWNTQMHSGDPADADASGSQATPGGNAFFGFTGGIWKAGVMAGSGAALFVDAAGNIGLLTADAITGSFNNAAQTWSASGTFTPTVVGQDAGIAAADFSDVIENGDLYGVVAAGLGDEGGFRGELQDSDDNFSKTYFIFDRENQDRSAMFGVYDIKLGLSASFENFGGAATWAGDGIFGGVGTFGRFYGSNQDEYSQGNDDDGFWIAGGSGTWQDGEIRGTMAGAYITPTQLGVLGGNLFGIYNDDGEGSGSWIAESTGTFIGRPLSFFNTFSASLTNVDGSDDARISAFMGGVESLWTAASDAPVDAIVIGYFGRNETPQVDAHIWGNTLYSQNVYNDTDTTLDGGAYYGVLGGNHLVSAFNGKFAAIYVDPAVVTVGEEDSRSTSHSGLLTGTFSGASYDNIDMFQMSGTVSHEQISNDIGIAPENLTDSIQSTDGDGHLVGSFASEGPSGWIEGYDQFVTYSIVNDDAGRAETWGIYSQDISGWFYNSENASVWSAKMGGNDSFGFYFYDGDRTEDPGYWIADITDGAWSGNGFTAKLKGSFITYTKLGLADDGGVNGINGDIFGIYDDESGDWRAGGVGTWVGRPLQFAADWNYDERTSLFYNDGGYFSKGGSNVGILGGLTSPWRTSVDETTPGAFAALGSYSLRCAVSPTASFIWNAPIESYNILNDDTSTYDGGAFSGRTAGVWKDGSINGAAYAIYAAPDGSAGILKGDVTGNYFSDIQMWSAGGVLSPVASALQNNVYTDPTDFYLDSSPICAAYVVGAFTDSSDWFNNFIDAENGSATAAGLADGFSGVSSDGFIGGNLVSGKTYFINDWETTQNWGIFDLKLAGGSDGLDAFSSSDLNQWGAILAGQASFGYNAQSDGYDRGFWMAAAAGAWQNGQITGDVAGIYLTYTQVGIMSGRFFGLYDLGNGEEETPNSWIGESVGYFQSVPLDFAGIVQSDFTGSYDFSPAFLDQGNFGSYDGESFGRNIGTVQGILGGFGDLWDGGTAMPTVLMGNYNFSSEAPSRLIWVTELTSYNVFNNTPTTFDNGSFYGVAGGSWGAGAIAGAVRLIYIAPAINIPLGEDEIFSFSQTGLISGDDFSGGYVSDPSDSSQGNWALTGEMTATPMSVTLVNPEDLMSNLLLDPFNAVGRGAFSDEEGSFRIDQAQGLFVNINDGFNAGWGIWAAEMGGSYAGEGSFRTAFIGESQAKTPKIFLSTLSGDVHGDDSVDAAVNGVWISESINGEDKFTAGTVTGKVNGSTDGSGTWQAAGVGEWVAVGDLDKSAVGYDTEALQSFVDRAQDLTERYSAIAQNGAGSFVSGGTLSNLAFNTSFYGALADNSGIWASIISGNYAGVTSGGAWSATINGPNNLTVNLTSGTWGLSQNGQNQWTAAVNIVDPAHNLTGTGQAGGTYAASAADATSGTLSGVGTGTWTTAPSQTT